MPILGAFGADGRPVSFQCKPSFGCQWGNYDRLSWVTLGPAVLSILDTPTVATTLNKFGGEGRRLQPPVRGVAPPPVRAGQVEKEIERRRLKLLADVEEQNEAIGLHNGKAWKKRRSGLHMWYQVDSGSVNQLRCQTTPCLSNQEP